jgi:ABC-type nickel/cobalt efflux system permease component RcnA
MEWIAVLALGFFLGMRHATDADHVFAVSTIVSRQQTIGSAARVGLWWGLGHTLTILVVGTGIVVFGWVIPPRLGLSMEFSVGLMLILLGVFTLVVTLRRVDETVMPVKAEARQVHSHAHRHGDYVHVHAHGHAPEAHPHAPDSTPLAWADRRFGRLRMYHAIRPLVVGMVHGLAGSAAVALLVLATITDPRWSVLYLVVFGVGTIVGMMLITIVIAAPFAWSSGRSALIGRRLRLAAGLLSLGFGILLAWRIGFVDGLFTGSPNWTPG